MIGLPQRFWDKVSPEPNTGCWLWTGGLNSVGYGTFQVGSRTDGTRRRVCAHRIAYESLVSPIPDGMLIDHVCRTRCCVNPAHLRIATKSENQWNAWVSRGTSPFKGVSWNKQTSRWIAKIKAHGKSYNLGRFATEIEAARAYDEAALKLHGEFALTNESQGMGYQCSA